MNNATEARLRIANRLLLEGRRDEAIPHLAKIISQEPKHIEAWFLLGQALDDPEKKIYAFEEVLKLDPKHLEAKLLLANLTRQPQKKTWSLSAITSSTLFRLSRYALSRAIMICLTILAGVFITVLITNKSGQLDLNIHNEIESRIRREYGVVNTDERRQEITQIIDNAIEEAGLNLPYLPRHLRWTLNALTMNWGRVMFSNYTGVAISWRKGELWQASEIILDRLPNTLILVGCANLIIFLVGIPLSLTLSRKHNDWQDKLFSFLAPISSIPSWVHGTLLILLIAVELRLLPLGGMFDTTPPAEKIGYIPIVARHMVLPVTAIILSMIFQLVYTWRTFFLIYSNEDYVELAIAKGLSVKKVQKSYILKPTSPFIITSFVLTLVSFWQMTIALEVVFNWPGIGKLYVDALPNFWGEVMYPGEMILAVSLVVIFAYLLGVIVFALDIVYAMIDPRIRVGQQNNNLRIVAKRPRRRRLILRQESQPSPRPTFSSNARFSYNKKNLPKNRTGFHFQAIKDAVHAFRSMLKEFSHYPSAMIGFVIIIIMVGGAVYAVIALPYGEIGSRWYTETLSINNNVPKLASPIWTNLFRKEDLLSRIIINQNDAGYQKSVEQTSTDSENISITFTFDYQYSKLPEEMFIYITPQYTTKRPFVNLTWVTPDQREIELKGFSVETTQKFDIVDFMPRNLLSQVPEISEDGITPLYISPLYLLFTEPDGDTEKPIHGVYELRFDGLVFEEGGDLDAELVLLGQVYGLAGSDFMRRDLLVPLLWGMPFALLFGLFGATTTTVLSMILAAAGVWFGGWVDALIQRFNEAIMILPVLAISVLFYAMFNIDIWVILVILVLLNVFGSPTKSFRAAFIQVRENPYIEAAQAYGASNTRIILRYMIPRIIPILIPQLVALIPSYVFLEATLGIFNITSVYPTWGKVIYDALHHGLNWGSRYWVLEPIGLLLLTGFAFAMVGFALDQILNPKLKGV
jgi:peptide/nickel transport system permease protein